MIDKIYCILNKIDHILNESLKLNIDVMQLSMKSYSQYIILNAPSTYNLWVYCLFQTIHTYHKPVHTRPHTAECTPTSVTRQ